MVFKLFSLYFMKEFLYFQNIRNHDFKSDLVLKAFTFFLYQQTDMFFPELRKLVLQLKKSIAANTETNILLYFVDRIHNLIPNTDTVSDKNDQLKLDNAQLKRKLKEIEKDKRCLTEQLNLAKMELDTRMTKNQKLERQIKEMRYEEARRKRRQKKEQQRKIKEQNYQESVLNLFSSSQKKQYTDNTNDEESVQRIEDIQSIHRKLTQDKSFSYNESKYFSEDEPQQELSEQYEDENSEYAFQQYTIVCAAQEKAVKVQPKI